MMTDDELRELRARYATGIAPTPCRICGGILWMQGNRGFPPSFFCQAAWDLGAWEHLWSSETVRQDPDIDVVRAVEELQRLRCAVKEWKKS